MSTRSFGGDSTSHFPVWSEDDPAWEFFLPEEEPQPGPDDFYFGDEDEGENFD